VTAIFALPQQYRDRASFIVSDSAARNLYLMLDTQGRPLWNVNGTAGGGPDTFLGYPIYSDPDMPAAGANNISAIFRGFPSRVHRASRRRHRDSASERAALR
jgi:HK97 family phage major capsid protein